jgi:hypothetical protein
MTVSSHKTNIGDIYPALYWARLHHLNTRLESMSFTDMPYLLSLYLSIGKTPLMAVEKAVQMGLSELFIIQSHLEAAEMGLSVMYVLPKYEIRNRFVNNRIYKLHRRVPFYKDLVAEGSGAHRTSLMHFGKGTLAFIGSNVEAEFIEMPVDSAFVDEKDRCNLNNLLLLPDRVSASPFKYQREISNPTIEGFGIDERYLQSSQGKWMIRCEECGDFFVPDFFQHVVREIEPNKYLPRDPDYEGDREIRLIHNCGSPVDRLIEGEWVHEYPDKEWQGYRISKLFSKYTRLVDLYKKWTEAIGNDLKMQVFFNSDLGLPYTSKGAKITRSDLNRCRREYIGSPKSDNVRCMGVDVGAELHIVIREQSRDANVEVTRLVLSCKVPSFNLVAEIIRDWNPRYVVIDAYPEIHKVMELKSQFRNVYSSRFQVRMRKIQVDKKNKEITMDRTAILDSVKQVIEQEVYILPQNAEFLDDGDYYAQLTASTRVLEPNETNPEKSRYTWVHTQPDHYFLAEAYCMQAFQLLSDHSVFDFFREETEKMKTARNSVQKKSIEELSAIRAASLLGQLRRNNGRLP